tara:strand:+ start:1777 stop:2847 length:1071 start_codon:yes stop_codon:yes gene_type:complete
MITMKRTASPTWMAQIVAYSLALLLGFLVSALLIYTSGGDVAEGFGALFEGAFGSNEAMLQSLTKATPLIFTGLATVIAFRAQVWSIGQEGQVFVGAMAGYWVSLMLGDAPSIIAVPVVIITAIVLGGLLAGFAGWLRTRFEVNEIISTVMLNYVVIYFLSYLLGGGPWTEAGTTAYHQTPALAENFHLPFLHAATKLHIGFILALVAAVFCYVLIEKTPLGFELRALGFNPNALRFKGTNVTRTVFMVMFISGGLAALAGVSEIFGVNYRLKADLLVGLGYTGIIVGMIGVLNPFGALVAALAFGALANGSLYMSVLSDVPPAVVPAMQGIILLLFLCASVLVRYKIQYERAEHD